MPSRAEDIMIGFKLLVVTVCFDFSDWLFFIFLLTRNWMNLRDADTGDVLWEESNDLWAVYLIVFPFILIDFVFIAVQNLTKNMKVILLGLLFTESDIFFFKLVFQRAS